jgi:transmembrane sensor
VNKSQEQIDELIGKYLAGEASADEISFVDDWAKASSENRFYVEQFRTIFQRSAAVKDLQEFDTDAAWAKLKKSVTRKGNDNGRTMGSGGMHRFWRIAASVIVVLGAGLFAYRMLQRDETAAPLVIAATTLTVNDTLPDGSEVFLNKETHLSYAFDKKKKQHTVKVKGEAFFSIQHDSTKNFLIDIDGVYIRDIGTSFNVKAYPESNTIEVTVEEGEVMFYTDKDSGVYLKENGKGVYDKTTQKFHIDQPEVNALSYKTRLFNFTDASLEQVIMELNQVYPNRIILPKNLNGCRLTVAFHNETEEEIVAIITETLGLTAKRAGDNYLLEGPGCD